MVLLISVVIALLEPFVRLLFLNYISAGCWTPLFGFGTRIGGTEQTREHGAARIPLCLGVLVVKKDLELKALRGSHGNTTNSDCR